MHLWDKASGFLGSVPIVAGSVSLAVGAALGVSLQKIKKMLLLPIWVMELWRRGCSRKLKFTVRNLPIVFVVENNLFTGHSIFRQDNLGPTSLGLRA